MQFLRNTQAPLSISMSAGAASGAVTATVRGEDGVTVKTGTATHGTGGTYTITCPPQADLNRLTTTWTGKWDGVTQSVETYDEVVGGVLFTIAEARAFKDQQLADANVYSDDAIRETRERIADDFQNCCGVPFFPRYERVTIYPVKASTTLWLPYKRPLRVLAASVDGVAMSTPDVAALALKPSGQVVKTTATWASGGTTAITVAWERGYRRVPEEIKRAALALAHYELTASDITDRMVTFANELGTVRLSMPGRQNPTGIPLVDAVLDRLDERDVLIAIS